MDLTRTIRDRMMKERLMFVYRGDVTNRNSIHLLTLLEKEMESSEYGLLGRKRLFMFALENLQNIARHGDHHHHADMSLVVYSKTPEGYTLTTGNVISADHVNDLKDRLDHINSLDIKDIRTFYRQILSNAELSERGGAGLGLIEMANKTGNKLDYDFVKLDKDFAYFILSKTVDAEGRGVHTGEKEKPFNSEAVSQLERLMAENDVFMIWSGHVTPDVGGGVLTFTETKLSEEDIEANIRRRVFSILVEILENVAKYSPGRECEEKFGMPVAMIRYENNNFLLSTGNLILNSQIDNLKEKLETVNRYDKVGLKELFRESLSEQDISSNSTGNMGLIDMARKSGSKLIYQFETVNDNYSYFTLSIRIGNHLI